MDLCEGIYDVTSFALNRAYKDVVKPLADIYNKASNILDKIPTPVKIAAGLVGGAIAIGTGIAPAIVAGTMIKAAVSGAVISGAMYGVSSLFTGNFDKKEFVNSMLHGATDMFMISGVTLGVKGVVDCVARNSGRIKSFLANESGEISVSKTSYGKSSLNLTKPKGWKVGDPIDNLTRAGKEPSWSTVRSRYWKNEAYYNSGYYSEANLARMQKGKAPINIETGASMELHHKNGRNVENPHSIDNLQKVWPWQHDKIDPYRHYTGPRPEGE